MTPNTQPTIEQWGIFELALTDSDNRSVDGNTFIDNTFAAHFSHKQTVLLTPLRPTGTSFGRAQRGGTSGNPPSHFSRSPGC